MINHKSDIMTHSEEAVFNNTASSPYDYYQLLKPRVMSLVIFTGLIGMLLAPGNLNPALSLISILCIAVGSGAAGAINMWYDRDIDNIMERTRDRPIPKGVIAPDNALGFGIVLSILSIMTLGLSTNWIAAFWLGFAIFFYVVIYTIWLKRLTPQNIVIGGAAGAFPPIIGWSAVTGDVSLEAFSLFMLIFMWTPPHFWALSLFSCEDYGKANIPMLPNAKGAKHTIFQIRLYTLLLYPTVALPYFLSIAGNLYLISSLILTTYFLYLTMRIKEGDVIFARKTFFYSIMYLFLLFLILLINHQIIMW